MIMALFGGILIAPQSTYAAGATDCSSALLGFPTWYRGLTNSAPGCSLKSPSDFNDASGNGGISFYIWHIVLNIIEILSWAIGYVAIGMIIFGVFQYITSAGSSDAVKKAKTSITSAIIGLIICMSAVGIINLISQIWK